jgi:hypothetical protein
MCPMYLWQHMNPALSNEPPPARAGKKARDPQMTDFSIALSRVRRRGHIPRLPNSIMAL